jgi:hypothetical protein
MTLDIKLYLLIVRLHGHYINLGVFKCPGIRLDTL